MGPYRMGDRSRLADRLSGGSALQSLRAWGNRTAPVPPNALPAERQDQELRDVLTERRITGSIQVSVQGPGFAYSSLVPAYNEMAIYQVTDQVNWIRSQVARLSV
jgi:hypothetical protein